MEGDGDGPERDETLRQMDKHGINNVRGWKYVSIRLSAQQKEDIESNMRELWDLCRSCGQKGHFVSQCPDRKGKGARH